MHHLDLGLRAARAVSTAMLMVLAGPVGASTYQWLQHEAEFVRCRSTMQELSQVVRSLPARAASARRPVQLQVDANRGFVRVTTAYEGQPTYGAVQRTLWLPKGLEVVEAPATLTVTPAQPMASASFLLAAPSHNTLFRLRTQDGIVRLDEEPLL